MKYSNKSKNNINILILGFNRSDLISKSIQRLKKIDNLELWISIDGPRKYNRGDLKEINKIKDICRLEKIPNKHLKFNKNNLGCRRGVIEGINWFFSKVNYGIIVEDDIELEINYIFQINDLLKKYSKDKSIYSISSHNSINAPKNLRNEKDFYLMPTCRVWGWGTWKDRWENHQKSTQKLEKYNLITLFFITPIKYRTFNAVLTIWQCLNNKFDTWDYEWNYFHILNNKKSITPKGFHILNHGFRKDATHTSLEKPPWIRMDKYKFFEKKIIDINDSTNSSFEKLITSECGFPYQENYPLEILRIIKYYIKNYINKFKKNIVNKSNKK